MQGAGHAAVVVYRKCPGTQQIQPKGAPGGFDCLMQFLGYTFYGVINGKADKGESYSRMEGGVKQSDNRAGLAQALLSDCSFTGIA